jgi:hypothetical protein
MASNKSIRFASIGGIAVEVIGTALSKINGIPQLVWELVLAFGLCLLAFAVVQWCMAKRKKKGGCTTPSKKSSGQVNAEKIEQGDSGTIIGQQNNFSQRGPTLIGNTAFGNGGDGFRFGPGVRPYLEDNQAIGNGGTGFVFEGPVEAQGVESGNNGIGGFYFGGMAPKTEPQPENGSDSTNE